MNQITTADPIRMSVVRFPPGHFFEISKYVRKYDYLKRVGTNSDLLLVTHSLTTTRYIHSGNCG